MSDSEKPVVYKYKKLPVPAFDMKYRKLDPKIIKYITGRVRRTIEYKNIIEMMKRNMDINKCTFYKDYTIESGLSIELHHAPFTLYDYVETVANKHFTGTRPYRADFPDEAEEEDDDVPYFEPWAVEEEVNELHFHLMVGLVPLNPTSHKLVHSGNLDIHPRMVQGRWRKFLAEYDEWLSDTARGKVTVFDELGTKDPDDIPSILKYKPILISNSKFKLLANVEIEKVILEQMRSKFIESQK